MKVILLQEVKNLGARGKVVRVKEGYARNFLFPRGFAAEATPDVKRTVAEVNRQQAGKLKRQKAGAEETKRKIESLSAQFALTVGEEDKPFGSVTVNDIAEKLGSLGVVVEKHAIQLEHPIKTLGTVPVPVKLHPEVTAKLQVVVVKA